MVPPDELANADEEQTAAAGAEPGSESASTTVTLPPPQPGADPNAPRWVYVQPSPGGGPGQVIVYEPGQMPPHTPGALPAVRPVPPPPPPPPQREWHREREWGMNIRLDGLILPRPVDQEYHDSNGAGLIGLGLSLRYRPIPIFAVDLSGDFMVGVDGNGLERREIPLGLSALFYFNPEDVAQFYAFAGPEFTFAQVFADEPQAQLADRTSDEYNYLGGRIGVGLELRVSELVGINIDGYGLLRTRMDDDYGGRYPEYYDERTGDSSNTTGALMLRGGATFWF
jgi:hypothetical protein